ncbi:4-alpha-glucanotransferase [Aestuariimicrobium ganziense]|uniref:4-alpha-glucanotransferase n=1 Tax=Aestuariimicrobium ganziense TaxID=2773677 RepID=UPI0019455AA3|nr:4-alpha-glucanotransferase [Aestuariimicrobium ganziense]
MALNDAALNELTEHFGIQTEFWDWKGRHTSITDEAAIAILAALGVDASTHDLAWAAVDEIRLKPWRRALPPCIVVEQGHWRSVDVHVLAGHHADLSVRTEDGRVSPLAQIDNQVPDQEVDGVWMGRATFAIHGDLPLGYHRLVLRSTDREVESSLIVTPNFVGFPRALGEKRIWGYATQLYSVRSERSWGVGDLTDLADLTVWSRTQQYADYVLINPLHAAQPTAPMEPSPYLPSSRKYVNPLYLRPEAIPEYAGVSDAVRDQIEAIRKKLWKKVRKADQIQRNEAWAAKMAALEILYRVGLPAARQMAFEGFRRREGRPLRDFATWCALYEVHGVDWRTWPAELQRPTSPEVAEFHRENADRVRFYEWLQWQCEHQVSIAQQSAKDAGMAIGVVTDLAVGVNAAGADTWMMADVFAQGVTVGAPPDQFNQNGQDWGQPPWRPDRLADLAYAPFREMVSTVLRHAGGIRVDHIIGLFRLWWVPQGKLPSQGAYVRYDHEALIGILALEAYRFGALVVGEDLGTVEPWVREYLARRGLLGTSVLWFENDEHGRPLHPEAWREYCMASVTTHDLPPTTGYLAGDHVRLRHRLGLLTETLDEELQHARQEQESVVSLLRERGFVHGEDEASDEVEALVLAMHRFLVQTPSRVLNVALTDAVGDRLTQNQPGTIDEYPNWRVPLTGPDGRPMLLEDVFASDRAMRVSAVMNGFSSVPPAWGRLNAQI